MHFRDKILTAEQLPAWRESIRARGQRLIVTNGCFDILHLGHVNYLAEARTHADLLLVGVNSDETVRQLKGANRPVNSEQARATVLAALEFVDAVHIFREIDALHFLSVVRPDIYVKGGDYTIDTINQPERRLIEAQGGRVLVIGGVPGISTTRILEKLADGQG
jgi:rfaE bifunctional protein nucleotidyltransferase chain/domain